MSIELFADVVKDVCAVVDLPDPDYVLETRTLTVEGFDVRLDHFENDPEAMYVNFHYGTVTAGRTLLVFRLLLEANLLIYAQDQAQLGLDTDTGSIVLILRLPLSDDVDGTVVADLFTHYAEHGRYWRSNIIESSDEMFTGLINGDYTWLRA
ncbi:molecular chaperone Tir [Robbsia andropogonis]|uniref:Molecular chaperone Tir n=1 Tax=Robbsia andropogonis TaxID=28092 RepID=A0A0F5JY06_9BURK|nr:CesT family type III secretion system chaperone [Robbsia andropogonis]KKB62718.1 molecular chaperone Tir [Robbsia andropogonis]MCP1119719.1 CesT family type III secretion system chaperone [Robbsia andropogonis]MCP1129702.1 CesT family type III secretion system chaperone [Robbsia andropogonis]